jgi:hypothetical protein
VKAASGGLELVFGDYRSVNLSQLILVRMPPNPGGKDQGKRDKTRDK